MTLTATPQNLNNKPLVEFKKSSFDDAIWAKGYNIQIDKAVRCPCEGEDGNSLSDCQNCQGTGYFYVNSITTIGLITGINKDTKFREWSTELIGTVSLSIRDNEINTQEKVSFYDRVTLIKKSANDPEIFGYHSEVLKVRGNGSGGNFVFLTYKPQEIIDVWYYTASNTQLTRIPATGYSINSTNGYVLDISASLTPLQNGVVTIRYRHDLQFHVIDIPHEVRYSQVRDSNGRMANITLPINAICRRAHLLQVERPNYDGTGILDNTYET